MIRATLLAALACATPALAQDDAREAFIHDNLLAVFYHELGHALIDVLDLPVLGQEEDAADALSTVMIDELWEEDSAVEIASNAALGHALYADRAAAEGEETAWHDVHGADLQRFYTHVCLFYGANPEGREDVAVDLGLPEDRAETCAEEFDLAAASWGGVLQDMENLDSPRGLRLVSAGDADETIVALIRSEIDDLNLRYALPVWVNVRLEPCGEVNAFYSPGDRTILLCTEYVDDLGDIYDAS